MPLAVVPRGTIAVWEVESVWGVRLRMPFAPGEFTSSGLGNLLRHPPLEQFLGKGFEILYRARTFG
jgi:hypothetical protein